VSRRDSTSGRSAAELLGTFGHHVGEREVLHKAPRERVNGRAAPRRGMTRRGRGWSAAEAPLATYRVPSFDLGAFYPLLASSGLPAVGAFMGYDALSGGAFYVHPVEWVLNPHEEIVTNPNMIFFGEPGRGKSTTIVAFLLRMMEFGVKTLIAGDTKGEYSPVVRGLGYTPIEIGHGLGNILNPLDLGPLRAVWHTMRTDDAVMALNSLIGKWTSLLKALVAAQGHQLTVTDTMVCTKVLRELIGVADGTTAPKTVTIPQLHAALANPTEAFWRECRFASRQDFLDMLRGATDGLAGLVNGPLAGLFDDETNFDIDWDAPIQSMDLSRLDALGNSAVAVAMTCLGSWSSSAADLRRSGEIRIVVRDEVWRQMRLGSAMIETLDSDLRLSRSQQKIELLAMHKPGDLAAVGDAGSKDVAIAKEFLGLIGTRVLLGQTTRIGEELAKELRLRPEEQAEVMGWANGRKGRALWKIQDRSFKVQTLRPAVEKALFDTNAQLRTDDPEAAASPTHTAPGAASVGGGI